jgi:hypothetical protein
MLSLCRDQLKYLPGWLDHYRSQTAKNLIIIDNFSINGLFYYLKSQKDVHCLHTKLSFRNASSCLPLFAADARMAGMSARTREPPVAQRFPREPSPS